MLRAIMHAPPTTNCFALLDMNSLAGTVHGLGLMVVSGGATGGIINDPGHFIGVPIPASHRRQLVR
jgi:hypothetical protein